VDDNRNVQSGSTTDIDVLTNDSDPDGDLDPDSLRIVSDPSIGSATVLSDHRIRYQAPNLVLAASTQLVYEVCDLRPVCDQGTLDISIFVLGLSTEPPVVGPSEQLVAVIPERERRRRGSRGRRSAGPR
jgi:hypothetical protein